MVSGYEAFSISRLIEILWPISELSKGFTSCFLIFYLLLPFLKSLVSHLNERLHIRLIVLLLFVFSILPYFPNFDLQFNYVTWFVVIYFIASYIRLYDKAIFHNKKLWTIIAIVLVLLSSMSVVAGAWLGSMIGKYPHYFFVADSNKLLAVFTSISLFMFFNNVNIRQSKVINSISASTFGVLCIHANCDSMRKWLWKDILDCVGHFHFQHFVFHAILSVLVVFFVSVFLDKIRIIVFEKPVMMLIDSKWGKIVDSLNEKESEILNKMKISD